MLRKLVGVTIAAAILTASGAAHALTITNRDSTEYSLTIVENDAKRSLAIKPEQSLNDLCLEGCTITLGGGDAMDFDGSETVMIEGGNLTTVE